MSIRQTPAIWPLSRHWVFLMISWGGGGGKPIDKISRYYNIFYIRIIDNNLRPTLRLVFLSN